MKQNRRTFIKSSATTTASATVFAGLINTPGLANADTTAQVTTQPVTTEMSNHKWTREFTKEGLGEDENKQAAYDEALAAYNVAQATGKTPVYAGTTNEALHGWESGDGIIHNTGDTGTAFAFAKAHFSEVKNANGVMELELPGSAASPSETCKPKLIQVQLLPTNGPLPVEADSDESLLR